MAGKRIEVRNSLAVLIGGLSQNRAVGREVHDQHAFFAEIGRDRRLPEGDSLVRQKEIRVPSQPKPFRQPSMMRLT